MKISSFVNFPSVFSCLLFAFFTGCTTPVSPLNSEVVAKTSLSPPQESKDFKVSSAFFGDNSAASFEIVSEKTGKCLDVSGAANWDGANIQQWSCVRVPQQLWQIVKTNRGYLIFSTNSGRVLDVQNGAWGNGGNIQQWRFAITDQQFWSLRQASNGNYEIISNHSGKCLDVAGAGASHDGANVQQWDCNSVSQQRWSLREVPKNTIETFLSVEAAARVADTVGNTANSLEKDLLRLNPDLITGTLRAILQAKTFAWINFFGTDAESTRQDAYRHAAWNALIAKNSEDSLPNVIDRVGWAKDFTDAHENIDCKTYLESTDPARYPNLTWDEQRVAMDCHNNRVGRLLYQQYPNQDALFYDHQLFNFNYQYANNASEIFNASYSTLVYLVR